MKKPSYNLINLYNRISAATKVGLGFEYKGVVYLAYIPRLSRKYTYTDKQSVARGSGKTIRIAITLKQMEHLVKTAIPVGTYKDMQGVKNKGEQFERLVYEYYGQAWTKDNTPYYKAGDIEIDGEQVQLKYNHATATTYNQLNRYSKGL